ncbi:hypothetical protein Leryth_017207 [Lithospermum erythrorhizon]|nr:hypothetical protein Leryth_017207 [Lithospermum erythrorhizon]
MEEAEKRSERLRAMRMQAERATSSQDTEGSLVVPPNLVNPLNESSASPASSPAAARFDYYTDPMAAFSRRGKVGHQVPPTYHTPPRPEIDTTPTPAYRANSNSQGPGYYHNSQFSTPTQTTRPFGMPRVNSPGVFRGPNAYPPDQSMFQAPEVYGAPAMGRPMQTTSPFGRPPMNSPGVFSGSSGPPNQYFTSNLSGATNFHSPQRGGSPSFNYGRGRGQRFNDNPSPRSERGGSPFLAGRGRNNSFIPASAQSHRGRSGSHNDVSAEVRPERFYHKSMVEDPWRILKPVIWRPRNAIIHKYLKSSVPNSISKKKPKLSDDSSKSTPAPSLAEYLAASFSEAVDNESS